MLKGVGCIDHLIRRQKIFQPIVQNQCGNDDVLNSPINPFYMGKIIKANNVNVIQHKNQLKLHYNKTKTNIHGSSLCENKFTSH